MRSKLTRTEASIALRQIEAAVRVSPLRVSPLATTFLGEIKTALLALERRADREQRVDRAELRG